MGRAPLEAALVFLEGEVLKIKRRLNKLSTSYRLPPEILGTIFVCVARDAFDSKSIRVRDAFDSESALDAFDFPSTPSRPYDWIKLTHVCYDWRQVALRTPRLWSYISLGGNIEMMLEMFGRAKETPLHVDIYGYKATTTEVVGLAFAHIHHTAVLRLRDYEPAIGDNSFPLLAPILGRLELSTDDAHSPIANMIRNCRMPELFHLDICSPASLFPWSHPVFQNSLTYLTFDNTNSRMSIRLEEVLGALNGMPNLKLVDFNDMLNHPSSLRTCSTIHLSQLEVLRLRGSCEGCVPFLQHITYPCTTRLSISITRASEDKFMPANLCHEISSKLRHGLTLRSLYAMKLSNADGGGVMAWTKQIPAVSFEAKAAESEDSHPILRIAFAPGCEEVDTTSCFLNLILNSLPLSAIHTLSLDRVTSSYTPFSSHMPNIEELRYSWKGPCKSQPRDLEHLLMPEFPPHGPQLPRLRIMVLVGIALYRSSAHVEDDEIVRDFCETLEYRKDAGHIIEELILERATNVDQSAVDAIGRTVGKVVWDPNSVEWTSGSRSNTEELFDSDDEDYSNGLGYDEDSEPNYRPYGSD